MADAWRRGQATSMTYGDQSLLHPVTLYSRQINFEDRIREYERNKKHGRNDGCGTAVSDARAASASAQGLTPKGELSPGKHREKAVE